MSIRFFAALLILFSMEANAQGLPIGSWRSHYPYNVSQSIATDGQTIFSAAGLGFLTYDVATGEMETYSKVNGMGDVNTVYTAHDVSTGTTVIAYENSNIDLFRGGSFTPIPDLKLKTATGSKRISHIWAEGGTAWLSTGLGIVVLDLEKGEVEETYTFGSGGTAIAVQAFQPVGPYFYAATGQGLYRALRSSPRLTDFSTWQRIGGSNPYTGLAALGDTLYLHADTGVLRLRADTTGGAFDTVFRSRRIVHIDAGRGGLLVSEFGGAVNGVKKLREDGVVTDSFSVPSPANALELAVGSIWAADRYGGITRREGATGFKNIIPPGPQFYTAYDIQASGGEVLVSHGGFNDAYVQRSYLFGASVLKDGKWTVYSSYNYAPFEGSVSDITPILKGPDGTIYMGSLADGLQIIKPDGSYERLREGSIIENAYNSNDDSAYNVISLAFDNEGNLVVGQFAARAHEFAVRTTSGEWFRYTTPISTSIPGIRTSAAGMTIDDANQRWYFAPQGGGLFCYNDGGTPAVPGDDQYRYFTAGEGSGGLPSSGVLSLAKDRDGAIWVGTSDGIGIISCASTAIADRNTCEAERPVVQYDQFAGYLFEGQQVRTMAIDGANRKWIGTLNGVWLISPNGDSVVLRFTSENSPLPSNVIQKIAVDGITGDVYIGTDAGLLSYRGTATDGAETNEGLVAYPNPVPSGYRGTIAVRGLVDGADVRITDIAGQLVFRTKALGGQAVWNGMDYTGKRPQSGVYLVFVTNNDGTQTGTGKIVFME